MEILVTKNSGYNWYSCEGVHFKGYFQRKDDTTVYRDFSAAELLSTITDRKQLKEFLKNATGVFSFVIEKEDKTFAAVDISRSMPLFFSADGQIVSDSAEEIRKRLSINAADVDDMQFLSLLSADYLIYDHTVYSDIRQLDLGELAEFCDNNITVEKYFFHLAEVINMSVPEQKEYLYQTAINSFLRLKAAIAGRPVVLSMSGGYDSRFVGCMLKLVGVEDVSCYTYGKADSFEVEQSRKNAEALGYRWICVEYSDDEMRRALDEVGVAYLNSYTTHDFTAYMQNFPAVRKLHENQWFKPNSVFITGLCGDMPTGNYIVEFDEHFSYTTRTAAEHLYELVFTRFKMPLTFRKQWLSETEEKLENLPIKIVDYQSWVSAVDCLYTGMCHSRWFMHMNTVHDFFGYEWLLPCWDADFLQGWYRVPASDKINQKLYEEFLLQGICEKFGLGQKKYRATYSTNETVRRVKYVVGSVIAFFLLNLGVPFKRSYDYNNFAPLELMLFQKLLCRTTVRYKKAGLPHLLNQYLTQRRYGVKKC